MSTPPVSRGDLVDLLDTSPTVPSLDTPTRPFRVAFRYPSSLPYPPVDRLGPTRQPRFDSLARLRVLRAQV